MAFRLERGSAALLTRSSLVFGARVCDSQQRRLTHRVWNEPEAVLKSERCCGS